MPDTPDTTPEPRDQTAEGRLWRCCECGAESYEPDGQAFEFCEEDNVRPVFTDTERLEWLAWIDSRLRATREERHDG